MSIHARSASSAAAISTSPIGVAIAGWLLPGAGYVLLGQRARALVIGVTIIVLFTSGLLLAGVRVIDVPGYDRFGRHVKIDAQGHRVESFGQRNSDYENLPWALSSRGLFGEVVNKPWYVCQILTGPLCLITSNISLWAARSGIASSHARIFEIGTLYTSIAGLLNLLAIIDASYRATRLQEEHR